MSSSRAAQRETVLVRLVFGEKSLERLELVPVLAASDGVPQIAEGKGAEQVLGNLDKLCWNFNSRILDGRVEMGEVRQAAKPKRAAGRPHKSASGHGKSGPKRTKAAAKAP